MSASTPPDSGASRFDGPAVIVVEPFGGPGWRACVSLRDRILRRPLALRFDSAELADERACCHLALWCGAARLAGCALLLLPDGDGVATVRQMAVTPVERGRGFGAALLARAEAEARDRGAVQAHLVARETAIGFYRRAGYAIAGPSFISVTLPHRPMTKALGRPDRTAAA